MTDQLTTKQRLNLETADIKWKDLELFFAQGKLLVVDQNIDMLEVAEIVAENKVNELERLISEQKIEFSTPEWVSSNCHSQTLLWAVVVSPYVLTQLKK